MKRNFKLAARLCLLSVVATLSSCMFELPDEDFDRELMVGTWCMGTLYEIYHDDGSGKTWDEAEDVIEAEAQVFTWTLEGSELLQIHIMEIGGEVPKVYTVTELTDTSLSYEDDFGKSYTFVRIE